MVFANKLKVIQHGKLIKVGYYTETKYWKPNTYLFTDDMNLGQTEREMHKSIPNVTISLLHWFYSKHVLTLRLEFR